MTKATVLSTGRMGRALAKALVLALPIIIACFPEIAAAAGERAADGFGIVEEVVKNNTINLREIGTQLFYALFLIAFTWQTGTLALEGGDITNTLGGVLRTVFLGSLAFWFLTPLSGSFIPSQAGQLPLVWFVDSLTSHVAGALLGNDNGSMGAILQEVMAKFIGGTDSILLLLRAPFKNANGFLNGLEAIGIFFANLPSTLYFVAAFIVMFIAGIAFFVMASVGLLMFTIGVALAPLFIPWMVFPAASFLFDGWLKFMISASLYKVAGAAVITLGSAIIPSVIAKLPAPGAAAVIDPATLYSQTTAAMLVAAVAAALAYLVLQIPSIAQGLVNGNASVSMGRLMSSLSRGGAQAVGAGLSAGGAVGRAGGAVLTGVGHTPANVRAAVQAVSNAGNAVRQGAATARTTAANLIQGASLLNATSGPGAVARAAGGAGSMAVLRGGMAAARAAGGALSSGGRAMQQTGGGMMRGGRR